jgi:arylformamidase
MRIFDISLPVEQGMLLYPGDPGITLTSVLDMSEGDDMNVTDIKMAVHTGTHIDSPLHFLKEGRSITDIPITEFYGKCHVLDLTFIEFGDNIRVEHLKAQEVAPGSIILFKTKNSTILKSKFREDFVSLSLEAAEYIISSNIKTIGIDYLSIGDTNIHKALLSKNIVIYESFSLNHVNPGKYTFIGFPLKLKGSEGAPTRAVLIEE